MGKKFRTKVAESKAITVLRQQTIQAWQNVTDYVSGALEQLAMQIGHAQRIQAAMLDVLEERTPGTTDRIKAIMEEHQAKFEAEEKARKEEAEKLKAQKEEERAAEEAAPACDDCAVTGLAQCISHYSASAESPADIAPSEVVDVAPLPQTD